MLGWRCSERYRRFLPALVLGCSILAIGATASATVVLEPSSKAWSDGPRQGLGQPSKPTGGASRRSETGFDDATSRPNPPWSWLIIALLIGLSPLAIERINRAKATRRRRSRLGTTMLEAVLEPLRARHSCHLAGLAQSALLSALPDRFNAHVLKRKAHCRAQIV